MRILDKKKKSRDVCLRSSHEREPVEATRIHPGKLSHNETAAGGGEAAAGPSQLHPAENPGPKGQHHFCSCHKLRAAPDPEPAEVLL